MKRANIIVLGIVIVGVGAIIWFEGFQDRKVPVLAASETEETASQTKAATTTKAADANTASANEPAKHESAKAPETSKPATPDQAKTPTKTPAKAQAAQPEEKAPPKAESSSRPPVPAKTEVKQKQEASKPQAKETPTSAAEEKTGDPNNPMEALNLKDVEMKNLVQKIGEWTGKVIIPVDDAMKQKITVFAPDKLPRNEALSLIYQALRTKGYVAEETDRVIYLKPIAQAKQGMVPTVGPDDPLAAFKNKEQVVHKFFRLKNFQPEDMAKLIKPLIGEYGDVSADPTTGMITAIDTVTNLIRVQNVIEQFDVPEADQAVSDMIRVQRGDPVEIVQMLQILLGNADQASHGRRPMRGGNRGDFSSTVIMGQSKVPIVLIPESKRKLIIVRASSKDMKSVKDWVTKLDTPEPVKSEYETIALKYADPQEVATRIQTSLEKMPGANLQPNVLIQPLEQSHQIIVFGRADLRQAVKEMLQEIDIPSGQYEKKTFKLKYADPEQIKKNIDDLYGQHEEGTNRNSYYYYMYLARRGSNPSDMVRTIAFSAMQQVTVICSPENMRKIEKQIQEWDQPLDVDKVKPQIITLKNSDPVKMAQLLTKLFSENQENNFNVLDYIYGRSSESRKKIIGPLYGKLTFEDVPGTKKIIVISKIPEAYEVIRELIMQLDSREMAEVPKVVTLKYANPEDLAERLNALFNERGQAAPFRLSAKGLSSYQMNDSQNNVNNNNNNNNNRNNNNNNNGSKQGNQYTPWWGSGSAPADQEPLSNVIGRVRFVPDSHSKSIMVLSPPEFYDSIEATIQQLDVPGKQVLVKAVIVEVDHSNMTSLGVQLATDPASFGNLNENSLEALGNLTHLATHGSATLNSNSPVGASGSGTILGANVNIYALLDFLEKKVHARILNQQSLWTKDNAEAHFFKGENVAFNTNSSVTGTGIVTGAIQRTRVGMSLRVRPSITPEERVDMIVNIILSQLTGDLINTQPVASEMETTTNMIVKDGQTIMLGGILFQRDSKTEHKLPLLGDLPLVGGVFRHTATTTANSELIVFITPYVMSDDGDLVQTADIMKGPLKKLHTVQSQLKQATGKLAGSDPNGTL